MKYEDVLRQAHWDAADWFLIPMPMLVIPIPEPRPHGHVLRHISLISPEKFPRFTIPVFAGNDDLMQLMQTQEQDPLYLSALQTSKLIDLQTLMDWYYKDRLHIIGAVYKEAVRAVRIR